MSVDSTASPTQLSTFKNRVDLNSPPNKALQSTLSQSDHYPPSRHSMAGPPKDHHHYLHHHPPRSSSRTRTMSASEETSADTITELTSIPAYTNKHSIKRDRRTSELKPPVDHNDLTSSDRRNSTPQIYFSSLIPHAFRNAKHHHKTNTNNSNASTIISPAQSADTMAIKPDTPFSLKIPTNNSRITASQSHERLPSSQSDDSVPSSSFICEDAITEPRSAELFIFESATPLCISEIYRDHFLNHFHANYYGELFHEGPFLASLRFIHNKESMVDTCLARALIRTQYRNCDVSEIVNGTNENHILQILFHKGKLTEVLSYGAIGDPKANEKLYLFDKTNDERYHCKIGVIYQGVNQTNEYDIFSNDSMPNEMRHFLDYISRPVALKGFSKYRGDLDTKDDLHGEYSYYTEYENHEIMFNIAPLIPSTKANGQCIERKGLIGNAFVCVVFQEAGAKFLPDFIAGKVIQIYITVQPITINEQLHYKVAIWRRNDITSFIDPPGGVYKYDQSFCSYFLTLLLNSVNVAIESPSLRSRIFEQRQRLKYEELKKLIDIFIPGPMLDFAVEHDQYHNLNHYIHQQQQQIDMRPNARSESFAGTSTITSSDSTNTGTSGRTSPVSKKKGFSKKIFGVFSSSRSGSISSVPASPININHDVSPVSPQSNSTGDTTMTLGRTIIQVNKDQVKRTRSIKTNQAPIPQPRSSNGLISQTISVQPPTPSANPLNIFTSENLTQNNLLNTAAFDVEPRSRSNSSPNRSNNITNKSKSYSVSKIDEETQSSNATDDDSYKEDSSEEERSINRSIKLTSNINSSSMPFLS
ncbi:unnamed protein product [Adineta steineri]|uniref:Rap-GAP domain-containing protein n=2 Tax=Adineta steineri TaxID=433720 RepID=A0A813SXD2_9BILA|nr:unnamed protein product [Adineta steineri]